MAESMEEMQTYINGLQQRHNEAIKEQLKTQAQIGQVMSELLTDPRWELYARHINSLLEKKRTELAALLKFQQEHVIDQPDYVKMKVNQAKLEGLVTAYSQALDLITSLVKQGEEALKEL